MLANLGRIRQWCVIVFTELGNGDRPSHWSVYDGNRTINITPVGERQDMSPGTPWVKAAGVGRKRTVKKSVKPTKNELLARTNVEKFKKKKAKPKSKKAQMDVRMDAEEQQTPQAVAAKQAEDIISSLKREPKEPSEQDTFLQAQVNN
jgi:hypothetical protein